MSKKILIVDDDKSIRMLLKKACGFENFRCILATTGERALEKIKKNKVDAIVLDIRLVGIMSGWEVLRVLKQRELTKHIPVIIVSGEAKDTKDIVKGLRAGADDFLVKPFSPRELMARIKTILRRRGGGIKDNILRTKDSSLVLDKDTFTVQIKGKGTAPEIKEIELTRKEFQLLSCFMEHPNVVMNRKRLSEIAWGDIYYVYTRAVDKHVQSVRMKLGKLSNLIKTVRGMGYKFIDENKNPSY